MTKTNGSAPVYEEVDTSTWLVEVYEVHVPLTHHLWLGEGAPASGVYWEFLVNALMFARECPRDAMPYIPARTREVLDAVHVRMIMEGHYS